MGIKNSFNKFLKSKSKDIFKTVHISDYRYKKIAVDSYIYLYKYKMYHGDKWLQGVLKFLSVFRKNDVHVVFVFDGKFPKEKEEEQMKRRRQRELKIKQLNELEEALENYIQTGFISDNLKSFKSSLLKPQNLNVNKIKIHIANKRRQLSSISYEDIKTFKEFLDIMGIPHIRAPEEAEKFCSKLVIDGKVDAVLSDDTDTVAYGTPVVLSKLNTFKSTCTQVNFDELLKILDFENKEMFLDLCILCGTDYNPSLPKIGAITACKLIDTYKSLESISLNTTLDLTPLRYNVVRNLFVGFEDPQYNIEKIPYCRKPDWEKLEKILKKHDIKEPPNLKSNFQPSLVFE